MSCYKQIAEATLYACLGSLLLTVAQAQEPLGEPSKPTIRELFNQMISEGTKHDNSLLELTGLERLATQYGSDPEYPGAAALTYLYETHSFLGNHSTALRIFDQRYEVYDPDYRDRIKRSPGAEADITGLQPIAALSALDELADGARVVMINEAHHMPLHRGFTLQALSLLKKKGFTYFAAETLGEDTVLRQRGYPVLGSGRYTREPVFAEMIRTAIRQGYQLVRYEAEVGGRGVDFREQSQARNLIERILKLDPKAKILVHAGYSHIREFNEPQKWMAQYFKEWSGIDPLTIDQTVMMEHSALEFENPLYQKVLQQHQPLHATVLRKSGGGFWSAEPGSYDLTVFHPRTEYRSGRPAWLALQGARRPYPLPSDICAPAQMCLVQAKAAGVSEDAIAIDQIQVQAGAAPAALMLPRGKFEILVEDAAGTRLKRFTVHGNKNTGTQANRSPR